MTLRPLLAADLPTIEPWFEDAETRRWLGGADWPAASLKLAGPNRHVLVFENDNAVLGMVDCEIYSDGRASFALAIDPARRRRGLGLRAIEALRASLPDVREFFLGIERGNLASRALALRAGFNQVTGEDEDGFTYFVWRRDGDMPRHWSLPDA